MIMTNSQGELGGMSPPLKRHLELEIKTLQNAPRRDADRLQTLLRARKKDTQATRKQEGKLLLSLDNYLTPKSRQVVGKAKGCWKSCWSCSRPWVSKKYFSAELVFVWE
jgi:hypothetical protein